MSQSSSHVMIAIYIFLIIEIFNYIKLTFTANLTKLNISLLPKNCIFLQQSLVTLRASAFNIYKMNSPNRPSTSLNIDVDYSGTSIQTNPAIADIQTFLLGDSNTINKLLSLTDLLSSRQNLNFYIDDALRPPGLTSNNLNTHKTTNMGFGWINIDRTDNNPLYTFYGNLIHPHTRKSSHTNSIVMDIMLLVRNQFYTIVRKRHTESMTAWEKRQGIHTKKSKMRRAKRRTLNKRKNAHKNSQSLISHHYPNRYNLRSNVASLEHVISRIDMMYSILWSTKT
uniref:Uncharacterized protein n=1 Tax=Rhizophagus irregularis (strain DAOM 181602 / DAOM 197198 / MUCL 43194) TaxID=747089 RepID=U9SPA6_RHIID